MSTQEIGLREARAQLGTLANRAEIAGEITYLTRNGKRRAAIVPVDVLEEVERLRTEANEMDGIIRRLIARLDAYDDAALEAAAEEDRKRRGKVKEPQKELEWDSDEWPVQKESVWGDDD